MWQNDEAHATASKMPKLCNLEIGNMLIKTRVVVKIASECHHLKLLDVRGCWDVDDKLLQEKYLGIKTLGPHVETAMRIASVRSALMTQMMTTSTHEKFLQGHRPDGLLQFYIRNIGIWWVQRLHTKSPT